MLRQAKLTAHKDSSDAQTKLMMDRVNFIEKQFMDFSANFSAYSRRTSKLCENHDDLAKLFKEYSETESYNKTLSNGFANFSKAMTILGDIRELEAERIECRISNEFNQYEIYCKSTKDEIKSQLAVKEKELTRKRQMEQIKHRNYRDPKSQAKIDAEIKKIKIEISGASKKLAEIYKKFEINKINSLKNILLNYIKIELKQHTKMIEVLTAAYQDLCEIDDEKDCEESTKIVAINSDEKSTGYLSKFRSQSLGALNSIFSTSSSVSKRRQSVLSFSTNSLDSPETDSRDKVNKKLSVRKPSKSVNHEIEESLSSFVMDSDQDENSEEEKQKQSKRVR